MPLTSMYVRPRMMSFCGVEEALYAPQFEGLSWLLERLWKTAGSFCDAVVQLCRHVSFYDMPDRFARWGLSCLSCCVMIRCAVWCLP